MYVKADKHYIKTTSFDGGLVAKSCPTLGNPRDCSLPDTSVHGNFQARILVWVAISFSKISFILNKLMHPHVHCSIIYNSQDMEVI